MGKPRRFSTETVYQIAAFAIVTLIMLSALFPLLWALGLSFTSQKEFIESKGIRLIPRHPTLSAYAFIFGSGALGYIGRALFISVVRTLCGTLLSVTLIYMGAYALARRELPGRGGFIFMVLAAILLNGGLLPTYFVVRNLHLLDRIWALILPGAIDGFSFLVIKQFIENLPQELMDSAQMDGAGEVRKMVSICAPLTAPAIAAIALFISVGHWNAWFDALIYLDNQALFPFQLFLRNLEVMLNFAFVRNTMDNLIKTTEEGVRMTAVIIAIVPILCTYPFLQKYFTKGIYTGAVKG